MASLSRQAAVPSQIGVFLVVLAVIGLGVVWSFASPHGSSADDDFHLTSAWCSHGYSDYCQDAGDGGVLVPRIIAYPACYVGFPSQVSAGCSTELTYSLIYTQRLAERGTVQPFPFHWTMGIFAGENAVSSVQTMRLFNVLLAGVLMGLTLLVVLPKVRRALVLAWGVAVVPVGIFVIASTNPSSWAVTGVGLYWALLLSLLVDRSPPSRLTYVRLTLLLITVTITLVSRRDGGIYLLLATAAVVMVVLGRKSLWSPRRAVGAVVVCVVSAIAAVVFLGRTLYTNIGWPGSTPATDQPNPFIKTLLEVPSFFVSLVGGQEPQFVMSDSGFNQGQFGYRPTGLTYGLGWTDFSLPSIVGLTAFAVLVAAFFIGFQRYGKSRVVAVTLLLISIPVQIVVVRVAVGFEPISHMQPRYVFPILPVIMGLALFSGRARVPLFSRFQGGLMVAGVVVAGSIAWLATASRYAVGPEAAFTNFGQTADWWWEWGPSRLVWFLIALALTSFWAWASVWNFGARPLNKAVYEKLGKDVRN